MPSERGMDEMLERAREMKEREQRELSQMKVRSTARYGKIKATMNGHRALVGMRIDPELIAEEEPDVLAELVRKVVNSAGQKIDYKLEARYGRVDTFTRLLPDLL